MIYALIKIKSRIGLSLTEWLWLKFHKKPAQEVFDRTLSDLRFAKVIEEEPWETDSQGRELIKEE